MSYTCAAVLSFSSTMTLESTYPPQKPEKEREQFSSCPEYQRTGADFISEEALENAIFKYVCSNPGADDEAVAIHFGVGLHPAHKILAGLLEKGLLKFTE